MFGFIDKGGFGEKKVTQYCWLFSPTQMIYWPVRAAVKDKDTREWQHNGKRGGKKERERESDQVMRKNKSEDHAAESGHWFSQSLPEPAFSLDDEQLEIIKKRKNIGK